MRITNKPQMYQLLASGALGNTIQQWFSLHEWWVDRSFTVARKPYWGIRSLIPEGPCRLNVRALDVPAVIKAVFEGIPYNISEMIDQYHSVTCWAEVWDSPTGLVVCATEYPSRGSSWRLDKPRLDKEYTGIAAHQFLRKHLNANSLEDVTYIMEQYPDHVLEFSACENCLGTLKHRNHVTWELRSY